MPPEPLKLLIDVGVEPDVNAVELQRATLQLREELLRLDVEDVERPTEGPLPDGARGPEAVILGTLIVTASSELVKAVIHMVAAWTERRRKQGVVRHVTVAIDGYSIEVTGSSAEDQLCLIEAFLRRHNEGSG